MQKIKKSFKFNTLENNTYQLSPWFEEKHTNNIEGMSQAVHLLRQRYSQTKKWILVISSDSKALIEMQQNHDSHQPMLWVHANKVAVNQNNIEQTLIKGNCAAIVLCNAQLTETQKQRLEHFATIGNTHCVLFNK